MSVYLHSGEESEGAVDDVQVVVDGLGNTGHRDVQPLHEEREIDRTGVCVGIPFCM